MVKASKDENVKMQITLSKRLLEELQQVSVIKDLTVTALIRLAAAEYVQREREKTN